MTRWFLQWRHLLIFSTASCGARLDKPGINAAPVSRLLTRPGLILPALCRAFLSLAPRLSLGAGLADRIGHASRLILTLSRTPAALKEVGTRRNRQFFHSAHFSVGVGVNMDMQRCLLLTLEPKQHLPSRNFNSRYGSPVYVSNLFGSMKWSLGFRKHNSKISDIGSSA